MFLAFDVGTTGTKAALIGPDGVTQGSAYRAYGTFSAENGVVEQQAADWWQAVVEATHELAPAAATIQAIVLTGQMQDTILVDANAEPIRPVILYSDTRARPEADEVNAALGKDRLSRLVGTTQDASGLLAKLRWLNRYEPESLARAAHILLGAADYIAFKLTGIAATDTTTASTTGLYDLARRALLDESLLAPVGLNETAQLVPNPVPGGSRIGPLTPEAAQTLGLPAGLSVHLGPGDAGATTLGAGSGEVGRVYGYIGTSGWVAFSSGQRLPAETGVYTLAHPHPDRFIYIAPLLTAGGNLDWARDLFAVSSHADLIGEALSQPPNDLIYLPYLNGERSPFSDPTARGAFIGLNARNTRADLNRAVLEGVAYAYRHALETLITEPISRLTLTGGGTRSVLWCQLFADVLNIPIEIADDAANVGVRGALLAAQVARGERSDYAPPGFFSLADALQPNAVHRDHFERGFQLFKAAYPALKPIFAAMDPTS